MTDYLGLALDGAITFAAVFLAFILGLWQDRAKERNETSNLRRELIELFRSELDEVTEYLKTNQDETQYPIYTDVWESARASGRLSLLTNKEFTLLKDIYIDIRAINYRIEDFSVGLRYNAFQDSQRADEHWQRLSVLKRGLSLKIVNIQKELGWPLTPAEAGGPTAL
jgi:hypothetical protein